MYAAIRKYRTSDAGEVTRRVEEEFIPMISEAEGFVAYGVVDSGDGTITSVSVFDDQAGAEKSTEMAAGWVGERLSELMEGPPEVTTGEVTAGKRA